MRFARLLIAIAAVVTVSVAALPAGPANAAIRCAGAYQQNPSGEVRTPYCEDQQLAQIAQSYGRNVSFAALRNSYGLKRKICRFLRNDNRVTTTCAPLNQDINVCRTKCS